MDHPALNSEQENGFFAFFLERNFSKLSTKICIKDVFFFASFVSFFEEKIWFE
jgi:hypothetical protein